MNGTHYIEKFSITQIFNFNYILNYSTSWYVNVDKNYIHLGIVLSEKYHLMLILLFKYIDLRDSLHTEMIRNSSNNKCIAPF